MARTSTTPLTAPVTSDVIRTKNTEIINRINDIDTWGAVAPTYNYIQNGDPGAVGANKSWVNTTVSPYVVSIRNAANTGWVTLSGSGGVGGGYGVAGLPGLSLLDGLTWAPVFGRHPTVANFVPLQTITITSASQWNSAIAAILPGDRLYVTASLTVASGYTRTIQAKNGTAENPWMLEFAPGVSLSGTGVTQALQLLTIRDCDWFIAKNVRLTTANQGFYIRYSNNFFLDSCKIWNLGQEAYHIFDHSTYLDAWNCHVWDTGRNLPAYGEGWYLGTDENNGRWADTNYNTEPTNPELNSYFSIRQCRGGRDVSREFIEFKPGVQFGYVIGCTTDGRGYLNDGGGFSRAPCSAKGSDLFYFWNELFIPNEGMFHSYGANTSQTMGTGGWQERHTFYGNIGHLDESEYGGANLKFGIRLDTGKGHVVYNNNEFPGATSPALQGSTSTPFTLTATPAG